MHPHRAFDSTLGFPGEGPECPGCNEAYQVRKLRWGRSCSICTRPGEIGALWCSCPRCNAEVCQECSGLDQPEFPREFAVILDSGDHGRLASTHRTATNTWSWTLTAAGGPRQGGAWRDSKQAALSAWLDSHGKLLMAASSLHLRGRLADFLAVAPTIPDPGPGDSPFPPTAIQPDSEEGAIPPPPPPHEQQQRLSSIRPPLLECPFCPAYKSQSSARGLMRHLTSRHIGALIGDAGASVLRGVERGVCPTCCGLRSVWSRQCCHCMTSQPTRLVQPADRIVLLDLNLREREARPGGDTRGSGQLPDRWVERVSALPSTSIVHIPTGFRERVAVAMCQGLEDLLAGGLLELGRTKLLLSPIPRKVPIRSELDHRLKLWFDGSLEELLTRIEEQARCAAENKPAAGGSAGGRAANLTRSGAYSKAVASLTSSVASLTPPQQRSWASRLLPRSDRATALSGCRNPPSAGEATRDFSKAGFAELRKSALSGVKFGALSGAGPSGMRPEHLDAALLTPRRSVSARLLRSIASLVSAAREGTLPESAHWLTQSRLVFLRKPGSTTPRPIRVGEVWRRVIGKRLLVDHRAELQELFLKARQCGVSVPGGSEVLAHARRCLDHVLAASPDAWVMLDLDLRNAFPSFEWDAIRAAVAECMPGLSPWTAWCHGQAASVRLPDGSWYACNRGAE